VRRPLGSWARPIAALLALTLVLSVSAPVAAAEPEAKSSAAVQPSLRAAATATVAAKPLPVRASVQATPAAAASGDKGFFGTPAGKIALVVMAAGTGYMVYSAFKDNDPVKSVWR
jgi:hypothetical protein